MRCYYLSDLHLESQDFATALPKGDVLIIAGDLCHARCLDPACTDRYSIEQRARVMGFIDRARQNFTHVLAVAGNHEHYDSVFEETVGLMRTHLPGITVLDDETIEIEGVRFFGGTLWSDLSSLIETQVTAIRKGMGEYFFVKTRASDVSQELMKLTPVDTQRAHAAALARLRDALAAAPNRQTVVITHHAPSSRGLNPRFAGDPRNPAYASNLDAEIAAFANVSVWVHGHTHVARNYQIGSTTVRSNALGFAAKVGASPGFSVKAHFDIT